jgi:hypothetical protein
VGETKRSLHHEVGEARTSEARTRRGLSGSEDSDRARPHRRVHAPRPPPPSLATEFILFYVTSLPSNASH